MTATTRLTIKAVTPDWTLALCAETGPDPFFPEGTGGRITAAVKQAKQVCQRCPILTDCRQWALDTKQPAGVWGGLDEHERRDALAETLPQMEMCWERQDWIEAQLAAGMSQRKLADELGMSRTTLARFLEQAEHERAVAANLGVAA